MRTELKPVVRGAIWLSLALVTVCSSVVGNRPIAAAQLKPGFEYRVLATTRTSSLEKELNDAAEAGFRFRSVMGGDTAVGGSEVVAIVIRSSEMKGGYAYRLLATSKTSTMEKDLQEAADAGFEYADQTVFKTAFGGQEVVCILERSADRDPRKSQYKLVATTKTSTLQKELLEVGAAGYQVMGMTVAKTAMGGKELVAILRRVQ
jgi:hypothetical protein